MKVVIRLKNKKNVVIDLGEGERLEKYDHVVSQFRYMLVDHGDLQLNKEIIKHEELYSIELILD